MQTISGKAFMGTFRGRVECTFQLERSSKAQCKAVSVFLDILSGGCVAVTVGRMRTSTGG
jgi:hypothetical protein